MDEIETYCNNSASEQLLIHLQGPRMLTEVREKERRGFSFHFSIPFLSETSLFDFNTGFLFYYYYYC